MPDSTLPTKYDLEVYRGDTFAVTFHFLNGATPEDLTGTTFAAQIRTYADGDVIATPTVTIGTPASQGTVTLALSATDTTTLKPGVWDLQQTSGATVKTRIMGTVKVTPDVTR